jgi:hypothetical protein
MGTRSWDLEALTSATVIGDAGPSESSVSLSVGSSTMQTRLSSTCIPPRPSPIGAVMSVLNFLAGVTDPRTDGLMAVMWIGSGPPLVICSTGLTWERLTTPCAVAASGK